MANDNAIAVLGTGIMGAAMARNLLSAGMEVRVWNRSREKAEPLADDGATVKDSPAEAAEGAGFVLTMLAGRRRRRGGHRGQRRRVVGFARRRRMVADEHGRT